VRCRREHMPIENRTHGGSSAVGRMDEDVLRVLAQTNVVLWVGKVYASHSGPERGDVVLP
jgi:hypothetical protein